MAEDSVREQVIDFIYEQVLELKSGADPVLAHVVRGMLDETTLTTLPSTQFPAAAVSGYLPSPTRHLQGRAPGASDKFRSELRVIVNVFGREIEDPDSWVSNVADALWAKLHESPTKGGLLESMYVDFGDTKPLYIRPFIAFQVVITGKYIHTTGGI